MNVNRNDYKAAFDTVKFRESFEQDTIDRMLRAAGSPTQKETNPMNTKKTFRISVIAAALVAVLALSAFALTVLLSPKQVASQAGNQTLAKAFNSENAINIGQSVRAGDYNITLAGIVSGKGLTDYCDSVNEDKSYIVASIAYTDGRKISQADETNITFSPLVSGYKPWQVNAWTLNGGYESFLYEGVNYFIFECSNLEIFADHTVYLAAYEGSAPDAETFKINEKGEISFADGYSAPHVLFTLPLSPDKANPDAVKKLLASNGIVIE